MYVEKPSLNFLSLKTELKNSHWFVFLLPLFFRQIVEKLCVLFGLYCNGNISAHTEDYDLKFSIKTNFGTLISNLKQYFQCDIAMTSY